jgi:hypothetical protein
MRNILRLTISLMIIHIGGDNIMARVGQIIISLNLIMLLLLLLLLLFTNNVYGLQQESEIEIKNLTGWQWDQVKHSMNFTGIEIPDYVKSEYDIVINNDNDYDDDDINNNDNYCYTSKCLIQRANELKDKAESKAYWNTIRTEDALRELDRIEREMRLID